MSMLDLEAFIHAPLGRNPCDHVVVPNFVRPEALASVNRDYPSIPGPGPFPIEALRYGPACEQLLKELQAPELRALFAAKFGMDLEPLRLELKMRLFSEAKEGLVHNDSRVKVLTALIYFNETWPHAGGRIRLLNRKDDLRDYAVEVEPVAGNLLAFRRSETSYHGFETYVGERRALQMYWTRPKERRRGEKQRPEWRRRLKRLLKGR